MTKRLSFEEKMVRAIRRAVKRNPDFKYEAPAGAQCVYFYDGKPSCVVGHGFSALGIDQSVLKNGANAAGIFTAIDYLRKYTKIDITIQSTNFEHWLNTLQGGQDSGDLWKDALAFADRRFPKIVEIYPYRDSERIEA